MPADGGDEAQIRLDPNDPLNSYLDLSQLDQATLAACTQTLDITSENNGVTATLRSVVGGCHDAVSDRGSHFSGPCGPLRSSVSDASSPFYGGATLILPWRRPQSPIPLKTPLMASDSREFSSQKIQYAICSPLPTGNPYSPPAKRSPLSLSNPYGETSTHLFHWTVETQAPVQEATLTDQEGTMVELASSLPSPPVSPYRRGTHWTRMPSRKAPLSWMPPDSPSLAFNYPA